MEPKTGGLMEMHLWPAISKGSSFWCNGEATFAVKVGRARQHSLVSGKPSWWIGWQESFDKTGPGLPLSIMHGHQRNWNCLSPLGGGLELIPSRCYSPIVLYWSDQFSGKWLHFKKPTHHPVDFYTSFAIISSLGTIFQAVSFLFPLEIKITYSYFQFISVKSTIHT